jgi:hypothetical protein
VPKYWTDCDFIVIARDEKVERNKSRSGQSMDQGVVLTNPIVSAAEASDEHGGHPSKTYHKQNVADLMALVSTSLAEAAGASLSDSTIDVPFSTSRPMGFVVVSDKEDSSQLPLVSTVSEGGPAALAGVKEGWVVKSVDGVDINSTAEMVQCLMEAKNSQVFY